MTNPGKTETVSARRWERNKELRKILVIRFHAVGDVAITFPSCSGLRDRFPDAQIDYLTSETAYGLVSSLEMFDRVHRIYLHHSYSGGKVIFFQAVNVTARFFNILKWGIKLRRIKYDAVIDMQNNGISRTIRKIAHPVSWSEFDRYSPKPAGVRVLETIRNIGFDDIQMKFKTDIKSEVLIRAVTRLEENNYNGSIRSIVLNPAGLWITRNWPIGNYIEFANLIKKKYEAQFIILGTQKISEKAVIVKNCLGENIIDLTGKTSIDEALAVLQFASLVISEDSGLMHMAWVSGVPTIALLGSSNSIWTRPLGNHIRCLSSEDLPCGNCMSPECRYGDVHCLTRYTPEQVFKIAEELLSVSEND